MLAIGFASMASTRPESQVSIDDVLEYTSINENQSPEEEAAQLEELADEIPADLVPQLFTPEGPNNNPYRGPHPNTDVYAISKAELTVRAGHQFVPLGAPTAEMLAAAAMPEISELIPQDHPEWQHLRSGTARTSVELLLLVPCASLGWHCQATAYKLLMAKPHSKAVGCLLP